ncbi:DUF2232 domain-containing protein [Clostridium tyrobutyricum]|uniref:DUF2232 domain-containing protein n=1 Tax=Clostridium tyrobutyricum TaxID=1519 RepID=UPI00057CC1A2|nr:YybS family protein [Clostridium tyrobutyricum]
MPNKSYNTKAIVEAGLTTAIIIVITLICVYVPILSMLTNFILPIPIAILFIRQNFKVTLISIVASAIFIGILYNPVVSLSGVVLNGLPGLVFGYCVKSKRKFNTTIILLSISIFIGTIIYLLVYINIITNQGIYGFIDSSIIKPFKESIDMYNKMGVPKDQISYMESMLTYLKPEIILRIIPASFVVFSFLMAYICYLIGNLILKKLHYDVLTKPFGEIYMSTRVGTVLVVIIIIGLLMNRSNMELGYYFINFGKFMIQFVLIVDGVSLAAYYLKRKFNMGNKLIAVILIVTLFSYLIYIILGIIDMIADFRKLDPYKIVDKR